MYTIILSKSEFSLIMEMYFGTIGKTDLKEDDNEK